MALTLAIGGVLGAATLAPPAQAQNDDANTKAFSDAYKPFGAIVNDPAGDLSAARAMIPAVQATIGNATDKSTMGTALIALGGKLNDQALQKQGIMLALESGKLTPTQLGVYHYYLGRWAFEAGSYAEARGHYQQSLAAGYTEGEPAVLIAETYFKNNEPAEGLRYLTGLIDQRRAAGGQVPEAWLKRGQAIAVEAQLVDQADVYSRMLLAEHASHDNWRRAVAVVSLLNRMDEQGQLDLLRLMRATDTLEQRQQYAEYVETASRSGLPNEVLAVLEHGLAKGIYTSSDEFYSEARSLAEAKASEDVADPATLAGEARAAATGVTASGTGDLFFSLGEYAQAADMYQLALEKGSRDRQLTLTRLGMSQILAGQVDQGKATLGQVAGDRAPIARIWMAYADTKDAAGA
jgi:tetratricopeptide (TPR) repeat protein